MEKYKRVSWSEGLRRANWRAGKSAAEDFPARSTTHWCRVVTGYVYHATITLQMVICSFSVDRSSGNERHRSDCWEKENSHDQALDRDAGLVGQWGANRMPQFTRFSLDCCHRWCWNRDMAGIPSYIPRCTRRTRPGQSSPWTITKYIHIVVLVHFFIGVMLGT